MENKVVIITGATSGIGRETAIRLAKAGAKVVLSGRREDQFGLNLFNFYNLGSSDISI